MENEQADAPARETKFSGANGDRENIHITITAPSGPVLLIILYYSINIRIPPVEYQGVCHENLWWDASKAIHSLHCPPETLKRPSLPSPLSGSRFALMLCYNSLNRHLL